MFGNKMLIGIIFLFALCSAALPAAGDTYYVRPNGNDQAPGATARSAFRSIRRAAQALNHGDSIVIAPGVYREPAFFAERFSADGAQMAIIGDESGKLTGAAPGPARVSCRNRSSRSVSSVVMSTTDSPASAIARSTSGTGLSLGR